MPDLWGKVNHSCNPSASVEEFYDVTVFRSIIVAVVFCVECMTKGSEVTIDCGPAYDLLKCLCGMKNCRDFIGK